MPSDSFIRLTSFTVASGPAASSAVVVSIFRLPRRPPAALISSAASVWPLSDGAPSTAPGPERIVMWPNFTGLSGMLPLAGSSAAIAGPATGRSASGPPSVAAPMVTPSRARNSRRSIPVVMPASPGSCHGHGNGVNAVAPGRRLGAAVAVGRAGAQLVASGALERPLRRETLPRRRRAPRIERRVAPGRPAVRSHLDARYGARAPRPAADLRGSAHELRAISRRHDDGLHVEVAHGLADHPAVHGVPAVVEPRGEETLGAVIGNVDAREPLDGVRAEEAGHEGP